MPSDPGNMPFQRRMADSGVSTDDAPDPQMVHALNAENILMQEFNHANVTAYQTKDERAHVFNTYLVQMGVLFTGLVTLETIYANHPLNVLAVSALIVGVFAGVVSVAYFARVFALGSTLQDSLIAMNLIKEFYIQQLKREMPQLEQAFRWRLVGYSASEQSGKMPFVMSFSLALIGSTFFAFAISLVLFLRKALGQPAGTGVQTTTADIAIVSLTWGIGLLAFAAYYAVLMLRHNAERGLRAEAEKLGLVVHDARERRE